MLLRWACVPGFLVHRRISTWHRSILSAERGLLLQLNSAVSALDGAKRDLVQIRKAVQQLEDLFLIVAVGEFNSGKSALLNTLLGADSICPEGAIPTTAEIFRIRHSEHRNDSPQDDKTVFVDKEWLRNCQLVDTPGTNAIIRGHREITEDLIPRADLVLFVTSVDRPISESEAKFLETILKWRKKVVFVLSKIDQLSGPEDLATVIQYLKKHASEILGKENVDVDFRIFPVSSKQAKEAHRAQISDKERMLWERSGIKELENFVLTIIQNETAIILKLMTPINIVQAMAAKYSDQILKQLDILKADLETLKNVDETIEAFRKDMDRDVSFHLNGIDNVLLRLLNRCDQFLDERITLTKIFTHVFRLRNGDMKEIFQREVLMDFSNELENHLHELANWMVDKNNQLAIDVSSYVQKKSLKHSEMIGSIGGAFIMSRLSLLQDLKVNIQGILSTFNREEETKNIQNSMESALMQTLLVEASALGLGSYMASVGTAASVDFTGIIGAIVVAVSGLYIVPFQRSLMKKKLRKTIENIRTNTRTILVSHFDKEMRKVEIEIKNSFSPYSRFVTNSREKYDSLLKEFESVLRESQDLEKQLNEQKRVTDSKPLR